MPRRPSAARGRADLRESLSAKTEHPNQVAPSRRGHRRPGGASGPPYDRRAKQGEAVRPRAPFLSRPALADGSVRTIRPGINRFWVRAEPQGPSVGRISICFGVRALRHNKTAPHARRKSSPTRRYRTARPPDFSGLNVTTYASCPTLLGRCAEVVVAVSRPQSSCFFRTPRARPRAGSFGAKTREQLGDEAEQACDNGYWSEVGRARLGGGPKTDVENGAGAARWASLEETTRCAVARIIAVMLELWARPLAAGRLRTPHWVRFGRLRGPLATARDGDYPEDFSWIGITDRRAPNAAEPQRNDFHGDRVCENGRFSGGRRRS